MATALYLRVSVDVFRSLGMVYGSIKFDRNCITL